LNALALDIDCEGEQGFRLRLDCELPDTGITAIYGPSGSGKSTLLDCIAGLRRPQPGSRILFREERWQAEGRYMRPWERGVGYVFQDGRLFPHLDVRGNLIYALKRAGQAGPALDTVIDLLDLRELLPRATQALSAGQKQRVAIARALMSAPRLLLLDEPLANLDHAAIGQLIPCLRRLAHELALPMLYVSHDIEEVSELADHLLLLEHGRATAQGPLLELCSRLDTRLSHEERAAAIVMAEVRQHDTDFGLTELNLEGHSLFVNQLPDPVGRQRRVRIPARDISVCRERPDQSSILNILPVRVAEIEESGAARIMLRLSLGSQHLLARITRKSATELGLRVGDTLFAQIKSAALLMETADSS
jgi:molybdate transport system ATP-binding protein